jgi:hypothetical protein
MVSDVDLERWQALCDAATPGPWYSTAADGLTPDAVMGEDLLETAAEWEIWTVGPCADDENWSTDGAMPGYGMTHADAAFCAAARTALPALIAEVRSLRQAVQWLARGMSDPVAYARAVAEAHGIPVEDHEEEDE